MSDLHMTIKDLFGVMSREPNTYLTNHEYIIASMQQEFDVARLALLVTERVPDAASLVMRSYSALADGNRFPDWSTAVFLDREGKHLPVSMDTRRELQDNSYTFPAWMFDDSADEPVEICCSAMDRMEMIEHLEALIVAIKLAPDELFTPEGESP